MTTVSWYAMTPDLKTAERGPLDLAAAMAVIDDYLARLKPRYESGEAALAETMFGFSRGPNDVIEICLHTPSKPCASSTSTSKLSISWPSIVPFHHRNVVRSSSLCSATYWPSRTDAEAAKIAATVSRPVTALTRTGL